MGKLREEESIVCSCMTDSQSLLLVSSGMRWTTQATTGNMVLRRLLSEAYSESFG
jgi:hypothetical protein